MRNRLTQKRSGGRDARRDAAERHVREFVDSVRRMAPDFTLPKGIAADGLYLGGVWLSEPNRSIERGVIQAAVIFYGEAYYKKLIHARAADGSEIVVVTGFTYRLNGDQIIQVSMPEDWIQMFSRDDPEEETKSDGPLEEMTLYWHYKNGCLDIKDGPWRSYRPSDMAELIATGFPAGIVDAIHSLALLGDKEFRERVDGLPLRSAYGGT
jgi:hypothetical protein